MTGDGAIPSPNIWDAPGRLRDARTARSTRTASSRPRCARRHDWSGQRVLDVGCGTGFHLPRFAERAARGRRGGAARAAAGAALAPGSPGWRTCRCWPGPPRRCRCPMPAWTSSHARWAYFFGPGCEPGPGRAGPGRATRRDRLRDRQRRQPVDVRRLVPPFPASVRPRCGATVLGRDGAGSASRWTSAGRSPRGRTWRPSSGSSSLPSWPTRLLAEHRRDRGRLRGQPVVAPVLSVERPDPGRRGLRRERDRRIVDLMSAHAKNPAPPLRYTDPNTHHMDKPPAISLVELAMVVRRAAVRPGRAGTRRVAVRDQRARRPDRPGRRAVVPGRRRGDRGRAAGLPAHPNFSWLVIGIVPSITVIIGAAIMAGTKAG